MVYALIIALFVTSGPCVARPSVFSSEEAARDFQLAIKRAKQLKLDEQPELRLELDKKLYEAFLEHLFKTHKDLLEVSTQQEKSLYETSPMVKMQHLVLMARDKAEAAKAKEKAGLIKTEHDSGIPFKTLILKYSENPNVFQRAGNLDYLGRHQLPESLYAVGLTQAPGELAKPVHLDGAYHLLVVVDRLPWSKAPETYKALLRQDYIDTKKKALIEAEFKRLRADTQRNKS